MPRFTDADSDEERLPTGFTRIGYDADTQIYTFRDSTGALYESLPGNRYGTLHPVGSAPARPASPSSELEAQYDYANTRGRKRWWQWRKWGDGEGMRMMLPFALLVGVFLLLVIRFVNAGSDGGKDGGREGKVTCGPDSTLVRVLEGDTCWGIAEAHGVGLEELLGMEGNEGVRCERLRVGQGICVPA